MSETRERSALEVLPPDILGEASEVVEASDGEVGVLSWMIRDGLIDRINRALRSEAQGEAEQGPRAAPLHRYVGQRSSEGYGICTDCGARENTPEAARMCPARNSVPIENEDSEDNIEESEN